MTEHTTIPTNACCEQAATVPGRCWTAIGFWDDDQQIVVTGVVEGRHLVFGGDTTRLPEGGPWADAYHLPGVPDSDEFTDALRRAMARDHHDVETAAGDDLPDEARSIITGQGWNVASLLGLVEDYIGNQNDDTAYTEFLREHASDRYPVGVTADDIASGEGWASDTLLGLALGYVALQGCGDAFVDFLRSAADVENNH